MSDLRKGIILLVVFVLMLSTPFIYKVLAPPSDNPMTQRMEQIKEQRKEQVKKGESAEKFKKGMEKRFQDAQQGGKEVDNLHERE